MLPKIDSIDQSIIHLLSKDGRISATDIAKQIPDVTERTIRYRINNLLGKEVIRFGTFVIPSSIGFEITAEVLINTDVGCVELIAERMTTLEEASYVSCTLGQYDVGLVLHARDFVELQDLVSKHVSTVPGVKNIEITIFPILIKDIYHWKIPDKGAKSFISTAPFPFFSPPKKSRKIDQVDRDIIHLLIDDARMSIAGISRRLDGIPQRDVSERIDSLIKQNIIRVTAVVNPEVVGYPVKADIHIKTDSKQIREVANELAVLDETSWVACAIGSSDLSVQICVKGEIELYRFVVDVIHKIPGITKTVTSLVPHVLKDSCDWRIPNSFFDVI